MSLDRPARRHASRRELWAAGAAAVALVLVRAWLPARYEGYDFSSDQAVVGLMAKHLAELRTFPLFFYGQHYMLGVQAWLAAPLFLIGGTNVLMLKLPLVAINAVTAALLVTLLVRELRIGPAAAFVAALPFVMPPTVVASHLLQTLGASVEPFLYVLLLWMLRRQAVWFGVVLAVGFLHREFTIFAVPALLVVLALERSLFTRARLEWALSAVTAAIAVWVVVGFVKERVDVFGPSAGPPDTGSLTLQMYALAARLCVDGGLASRARALVVNCLPDLFGTRSLRLSAHGINSTLATGIAPLGALLVAGGLSIVVRLGMMARLARPVAIPPFALYLALVGIEALLAYPTSCEVPLGSPGLLRYALLALLVPTAVWGAYLAHEPRRALRAVATAVMVAWAIGNLVDTGRVVREYAVRRPAADHRILADYLVGHDIRYSRADYWDAYITDFFAREQVVVATAWKVRIREYERAVAAHGDQAATILQGSCAAGEVVARWCIRRPVTR